MHQVLYRKWRPRTFSEVCGQEHITSVLQYEVQSGDLAHAYLFCGSRGTGKTSCAKILSRAVNCEHPQNGNPCGVCDACRSVLEGTATDVVEMDAASNNGVDDIRSIREAVIYPPAALKYRVYIIDEVHMLSGSAFNALLKTLEEPPAHIIFILATTELQKLPATIVSRCQRFEFRRISVPILSDRLRTIADAEGIQLDANAAQRIARFAQGGMRDAISLLDLCAGTGKPVTPALVDEAIGSGGREESIALMRAVIARDYTEVLGTIDRAVRASRDLTVFWQDLIGVCRDVLVIRTVKESKTYLDLTDSEAEQLGALAKQLSGETLLWYLGRLEEALLAMQRTGAAGSMKRIVAEMTLLRLCEPTLSADPAAMLARVSALEENLARLVQQTERRTTNSVPPSPANDQTVRHAAEDLPSHSVPIPAEPIPQEKRREADVAEPDSAEPDSAESNSAEFDPTVPDLAEPTAVPHASQTAGGNVRQLYPLRGWGEIRDRVTQKNPMTGSFLGDAKAYTDADGRVILQYTDSFFPDMFHRQNGEALLLDVLSAQLGRTVTVDALVLEVIGQKSPSAPIDEIIEALEEAEEQNTEK